MYPKTHFFLGLIFIFLLWIFTSLSPLALLIILASSVLIDVDHWFLYVVEKKGLSIRKAYDWCVYVGSHKHRNKGKQYLCIFHTIEFFTLMFILSFYSQIIFYITIGCSFHFFIDLIDSYLHKGESRKPLSIISYFINFKKQ